MLVSGTDYNTSTANTISGLSALSSADVIEIIVYDIFAVADTVKSSTGGAFNGGVTIDGKLGVGTTAPAVNFEVDATSTNGLARIGQLQFKTQVAVMRQEPMEFICSLSVMAICIMIIMTLVMFGGQSGLYTLAMMIEGTSGALLVDTTSRTGSS